MADPYVGYGGSKTTPQNLPIPGEEEKMAKNAAGGFAYSLDKWLRFERFLILGSADGTYYVRPHEFTRENADCVRQCIVEDATRALNLIVDVRQSNRAPRLQPGLFALALWACYAPDKSLLEKALIACASTLSNLYTWVKYTLSMRGNGRAIRRAVRAWFDNWTVQKLVYQAIKYRAREGYTLRDILRIFKPKDHGDVARRVLYTWAVGKEPDFRGLDKEMEALQQLSSFLAIQEIETGHFSGSIPDMIRRWKLPREAVPTEMLNDMKIWSALLDDMPMGAMVRNLGKMTKIGLISPFTDATRKVASRLQSSKAVSQSHLHPFQILLAATTYRQGHGEKGKLKWEPVDAIRHALEDAFYLSFENVQPTRKKMILALDVSASMHYQCIANSNIEASRAAACMALTTARVEDPCDVQFLAFSHKMRKVDITPKASLKEVAAELSSIPFGGTDCSLPMRIAEEHRWPVDAFVIYTDNETWFGEIHPIQALRQYRQKMNIPAKLVVVGLTSSGFSIADPDDPRCLDVVGFDGGCPALISDFIRN